MKREDKMGRFVKVMVMLLLFILVFPFSYAIANPVDIAIEKTISGHAGLIMSFIDGVAEAKITLMT
jgi:hypothetical protein